MSDPEIRGLATGLYDEKTVRTLEEVARRRDALSMLVVHMERRWEGVLRRIRTRIGRTHDRREQCRSLHVIGLATPTEAVVMLLATMEVIHMAIIAEDLTEK